MTNNKSHSNSILRGAIRPFHLSKCNLEGCNNFITSLDPSPKRICDSHKDRGYRVLPSLSHLKRIKDYSETKAPPRTQHKKEKKPRKWKRY